MNHVLSIIMSCTAFFFVLSCGLSDGPHYKSEKNYGLPPVQSSASEENSISPDEVWPTEEKDEESSETPEQVSPSIQRTEVDPNTVVSHVQLRGGPDLSAIEVLKNDGTLMDLSGMVMNTVRSFLSASLDIRVDVKQTLGDGVRSTLTQDIIYGSERIREGKDSETGIHTLYRITGEEEGCPTGFVCAERMTWDPTEGTKFTICWKHQTQDLTVIPYSPAYNYPAEDFKDNTYGPFDVYRKEGIHASCDDVVGTQNPLETIVINVKRTDVTIPLQWHDQNIAKPDFSLEITVNKFSGNDDVRPYLDEVAKLQAKTSYHLSDKKDLLIKLIKTMRKPMPPVLNVIGVAGVRVPVKLELCQTFPPMKPEVFCSDMGEL